MKEKMVVCNTDASAPYAQMREEDKKRLEEVGAEYIGKDCVSEEDFIANLKDVDIIYNAGHSPITKRVLKNLPRLKAIVRHGIGFDNIDIEAAREFDICVSNCPGFCIEEVSTHCISLLLAFLRKIPYLDSWIKKGKWGIEDIRNEEIDSIMGEAIGIIGFGNIGKRIYEKINAFGPNIYIYDPFIKINKKFKVRQVKLEELLRESKYIILACTLTKENINLLDKEQFKIMRNDAVIINVSRGQLINEKVLIKYLSEKRIGGAALDVFECEPIRNNNPLLKLENVILTPHQAGISPKALSLVKKMMIDEIIRIIRGEKPKHRVN